MRRTQARHRRPTAAHRSGQRIAAVTVGLIMVSLGGGISLAAAADTGSAAEQTSSYGIWPASIVPQTDNDPDSNAVTVGTQFSSQQDGWISSIRFYKSPENSGPHTGQLWTAAGDLLGTATFTGERASGWQTASFAEPIRITQGTRYVASYRASHGAYADDQDGLSPDAPVVNRALTAWRGVFTYGDGVPSETWRSSNYYVDVEFSPSASAPASDTTTLPTPPAAPSTTTPTPGPPSTTVAPRPTPSTTVTTTAKSVPPSTTAAPTPTPTTSVNCAPVPSRCGYPDATNSGSSGTLKKVPGQVSSGAGWHVDGDGSVIVDGDGAVIDSLDTNGIQIHADNVTVTNCTVTSSGDWWGIGLYDTKNATIQDTTVRRTPGQTRLEVGIKDVNGSATGTKVLSSDVSGVSTGIQTHEGLIQDNYIHDLATTGTDHVNGTTSNGSDVPLTIRHNTVFNPLDQADAISLFEDFGQEANRVIDNNLVAGGSYSIYAGQNTGGPIAYNIKVTNNRIARIFFPGGGTFGPVAAYNPNAAGNVFSGNVWDDTNLPIPVAGD